MQHWGIVAPYHLDSVASLLTSYREVIEPRSALFTRQDREAGKERLFIVALGSERFGTGFRSSFVKLDGDETDINAETAATLSQHQDRDI